MSKGPSHSSSDGRYNIRHLVLDDTTATEVTTSIKDERYSESQTLQTVRILAGSNVNRIGNSAFRACQLLETVQIENGVTTIGYSAFSYCKSLQSIHLPDTCCWGRCR